MEGAGVRKAGPVEVVESMGIRIPIYHSPFPSGRQGFLISYYAKGKRRQERSKSLRAARKVAREKIRALASGAVHAVTLTPRQHAIVEAAVATLQPTGVTLLEAVRQFASAWKILQGIGSMEEAARDFVKRSAERTLPQQRVADVVADFLRYIETSGLSHKYLQDCRARLERFAGAFTGWIAAITPSDIETWLQGAGKRSARGHNNDRNAVVTLFNHAKRRGFLPRDTDSAADLVSRRKDVGGEIQILTPEDFARLLSQSPETFLPYVALGGLAGLRTAEICRLSWEDIRLPQGHIVISAAKAKTASRRLVPICPSLAAWLAPLARKEGRVMPYANEHSMITQWTRLKARRQQEGNPMVLVPVNALRHSYASYRLAEVEDAAKVSLEMGNSPRKLFANYRQLVTREEAGKWFGIFPMGVTKVGNQ
jgi:integrase